MGKNRKSRVLVSGFTGFPQNPRNPSADLARDLAAAFRDHARIRVRTVVLKTEFGSAYETLERAIVRFKPDIVIAFGVSARSDALRLETTARNMTGGHADAAGACQGGAIDPAGPATLPATLPLAEIKKRLDAKGIPAALSNDAGDYLCNYVFYRLMQGAQQQTAAGFVHIPHSDETAPHFTGEKNPVTLARNALRQAGIVIIEAALR